MKILFVDDNELNRVLIEEMIDTLFEDIVVDVFSSASEVLKSDIHSYDLILSDISMPDTDGYELYKLLRENNYINPIIAVTALAVQGDKEKILIYGFSDYISKPIDINQLKLVIQKYI